MRRLSVSSFVVFVLLASPLHAAFSGTDVFLGSVGRGPGASGSEWYTTVWAYNPAATPASVDAYLLIRNQANPSSAKQTFPLAPGETRRFDNIVETLFSQSNVFGAIRFVSTSRIVVNARIYNRAAGTGENESTGQFFAGVPASFAIGAGESAVVLGVYQTNPLGDSPFRYNYGFVETTGADANVHVVATNPSGATIGTKDYPIRPFEAAQFGIVDILPDVDATNVRLAVSVTSGSGKVIAFGSGIANKSNDATTFEMSFRDELLAEPPVTTSVKHDTTLTGDGSDAAPLGVANLGVGSTKINSNGGTVGSVLTATAGGATAWQAVPGLKLPFSATASPAPGSGVFSISTPTLSSGVAIVGSGGIGVAGETSSGTAVQGHATSGRGVVGFSDGSGTGVEGDSMSGFGVAARSSVRALYATAGSGEAVYATSSGSHGVYGESRANDSYGVVGFNSPGNHAGLIGTLGYAGDFVGDVRVKGTLSKFGGAFTIDHPLDPEHKTLSHSFVESPDMMNVYNGVVTTDASGYAVVRLPDWFEALNRDFRYQLTVIGQFAQAIIDTEIAQNRFTIRTDHPDVKVSWQVTGIRHDPWAEKHRIIVEQEKPTEEQGFYLAPDAYDQPRERDAFWAQHPELLHPKR